MGALAAPLALRAQDRDDRDDREKNSGSMTASTRIITIGIATKIATTGNGIASLTMAGNIAITIA